MASSSGKLSLSVVTCTYSRSRTAQLEKLLHALRSQALRAHEVIVVVDHNPDLLAELRERVPGTLITANVYERGLSGGRNTGLERAAGDVVVFIDDDATPERDWLERLAAAYEDPAVVGAGGEVEPAWDGPVPGWFPPEFGWVVGCGYAGLPRELAEVRNFIGCNMSFRRTDVAGAGGFRVDLGRVGLAPVGCEETEFCIRLMRNLPGHRLLFDPAARVRHFVPRERMTWAYFRARCYSEGRSKARVASLAGASSALSSERSYVARTLASAVAANLARSMRGDGKAALRAGAIVAGLALTTAGYAIGMWELAIGRERLGVTLREPVHQP